MESIELSRIYEQLVSGDASIDVQFGDSSKKTYSVSDVYARQISNRISIDNSPIDSYIDKIFESADWSGDQTAPKETLKGIVIGSNYSMGVELLNYLSNNKDKLLNIKELNTGEVVNFMDLIIDSLPNELQKEGLRDVISKIHYNVIPKASTNVGLGEGTFTIFGTATKGNSGDLMWDGLELEVKTNGNTNTGAVLGGDATFNKSFEKLKELGAGEYTDRIVRANRFVLDALNSAKEAFETSGTLSQRDIKVLKDIALDDKSFLSLGMKRGFESVESGEDIFINPTSKSFLSFKKPTKASVGQPTLYSRVKEAIDERIKSIQTKGENLPSQLSSFFDVVEDSELLIRGFAEMKTYANIKTDINSQLVNFFNSHNIQDFKPSTSYTKFSTLIGAISIICYRDVIGFDILSTGNDKTFEMFNIDCREKTVSDIYDQVIGTKVLFDLNIDAYENGVPRSQTVFAKSPRIKLQ